jgi:transcriptional regulator with XRE-family HTH domain
VLSMAIRIRQARKWASLTQSQLAGTVGVNRSAVAQWERDRDGTTPSVANLASIAVATGIAFEWLATGRGNARGSAEPVASPAAIVVADEVEARCIEALRRLSPRRKELIGSTLALLLSSV